MIAIIGILAGFGCAPEDTTKAAETPDADYRTLSEAEYEDKVAGGWLGQAIGVLYGRPSDVHKSVWNRFGQSSTTRLARRGKVQNVLCKSAPGGFVGKHNVCMRYNTDAIIAIIFIVPE